MSGAQDSNNNQSTWMRQYTDGERIMKTLEKAEGGKRADQAKMSDKNKREHIDQAFVYFSSACVDNPEFAMAYYKRGKCYMMMHDYKRALYDFSAAILNETRSYNK